MTTEPVHGSRTEKLPGVWLFQADPENIGEKGQWFAETAPRKQWRRVKVPGAWDFYDAGMQGYEGVAWFATQLVGLKPDSQRWQRLRFAAVYYEARVWLDGQPLCKSQAPYLPFECDVSPALRGAGSHWLVVRIDNSALLDRLPGTKIIEWPLYGGILQDVQLLTTRKTYLKELGIAAVPAPGGAEANLSVQVVNRHDEPFAGRVATKVRADGRNFEASSDVQLAGGETRNVLLRLSISKARTWSPERPVLYPIYARLENVRGESVDRLTDRFGIRSIQVAGTKVMLNGAPLQIRGVNRYDYVGNSGPRVDAVAVRRDLQAIKAMGANMIRLSYPQDPMILDLADELGLLVLEEVPLCWWKAKSETEAQRKDNAAVVAAAQVSLDLMLNRDRNHPAIIMWGMANESGTEREAGTAAMERLLARARQTDPTRLLTFVTSGKEEENRAFAAADVVSFNLYLGWFFGEKAFDSSQLADRVYLPTLERLRAIATHFAGKPLLVTEFGAGALSGSHGDTRYSEDLQADYLVTVWRALMQVPSVSGGIVWSWADYVHRRSYVDDGGWPTTFGAYGLVGIDRKPKMSLRALSNKWRGVTPRR